MGETSDHGKLLDEAIDLMIRYQNDTDNPVAAEMIRAWRIRSPEHERAWLRVSKIHGSSGTILTEQRRIERRDSLSRRNFMLGGFATVGLGAAALSFGPGLLLQARADHMTAKGEIRRIDLPDGSVATLGPESAIAVRYGQKERSVELLAGMCFFDLQDSDGRPFSARCDDLRATADGGAFDMSNDAGVLSLSVDRGSAGVEAKASILGDAGELSEGQWISYDPATGEVNRGEREPSQIASWRDRLILADRDTVSALVARIGRWVPGRVVLADPFIGNQRVSGVYDLNDPLRALEAVVLPAGGRVRRISSFVTVISPV